VQKLKTYLAIFVTIQLKYLSISPKDNN